MAITDPGRIDPTAANSAEEFVVLLRQVRAVTGLSFWDIETRAREYDYELDPATLARAFSANDLPGSYLVAGLLLACGLSQAQVDYWLHIHAELSYVEPDPLAPEVMVAHSGAHRRRPAISRRQMLITAATAIVIVVGGVLVMSFWPGPPMVAGQPSAGGTTAPAESAPAEVSPTPETTMATPRPVTSSTADAAGVLRSGAVTLTAGQGIDLDTGQASGGLDIVATGDGIRAGDNGKRLELMPGPPSKQDCAGLNNGQLARSLSGLTSGSSLCVRTTDGRWARVGVSATSPNLVLNYVVWS